MSANQQLPGSAFQTGALLCGQSSRGRLENRSGKCRNPSSECNRCTAESGFWTQVL